MIKKLSLGLVSMVLALGSLTACGNGGSTYVPACVDPITQIRVADYMCGVGYHPSWWYYYPSGAYIPGVGIHVTHYSVSHYHVPAHAHINRSYHAPVNGGKVSLTKSGSGSSNKSTKTKNGGGFFKSRNSGGSRSGGFRSRH